MPMPKSVSDHLKNDADRGKGSKEPDERSQSTNNSMTCLLYTPRCV